MKTKSILTPLLLLSFATGLYNPIKAAESKQVRINVLFQANRQAGNRNASQQLLTAGITVVNFNQNSPVNSKHPSKLISDLLGKIDTVMASVDTNAGQVQGRIVMKVPADYIKKEHLSCLENWFTLISNDTILAQCTTLVITGKDAIKAKDTLARLVKDANKSHFFTQQVSDSAPITLHDDKVICAGSSEKAVKSTKDIASIKKSLKAITNRGYIVFHVGTGNIDFTYSFFLAEADNNDPTAASTFSTNDIDLLKAHINDHKDEHQICAIVLKFSADDFVNNFSTKKRKLLAHFIEVFGSDQSLKHKLISLGITGSEDHKAQVLRTLLWYMGNPVAAGNIFFKRDGSKTIFTDDTTKIVWGNSSFKTLAIDALVIDHIKIENALDTIKQKANAYSWQHKMLMVILVAVVVYRLYVDRKESSPKDAKVDKKSEYAPQVTDTDTTEANSSVNNPAQPQISDTPSTPASGDDTSVPASNSGNRPSWGFQQWRLLIMAMILILGGVYWYIRRQQKA